MKKKKQKTITRVYHHHHRHNYPPAPSVFDKAFKEKVEVVIAKRKKKIYRMFMDIVQPAIDKFENSFGDERTSGDRAVQINAFTLNIVTKFLNHKLHWSLIDLPEYAVNEIRDGVLNSVFNNIGGDKDNEGEV